MMTSLFFCVCFRKTHIHIHTHARLFSWAGRFLCNMNMYIFASLLNCGRSNQAFPSSHLRIKAHTTSSEHAPIRMWYCVIKMHVHALSVETQLFFCKEQITPLRATFSVRNYCRLFLRGHMRNMSICYQCWSIFLPVLVHVAMSSTDRRCDIVCHRHYFFFPALFFSLLSSCMFFVHTARDCVLIFVTQVARSLEALTFSLSIPSLLSSLWRLLLTIWRALSFRMVRIDAYMYVYMCVCFLPYLSCMLIWFESTSLKFIEVVLNM
jgi:hypothetical protein